MSSRDLVLQKEQLSKYLMRHNVDGETAFHILMYHYVFRLTNNFNDLPRSPHGWKHDYTRIAHDLFVTALLDDLVAEDPMGYNLAEWYLHFVGRRFREGSGKFFTPRPIAHEMARMLPIKHGAVIMDPTCGGGTFLLEASNFWGAKTCTLVGNDAENSLVELSTVVLHLATPQHHTKHFSAVNIFDNSQELDRWQEAVDYILANPPFSIRIDHEQFDSMLFQQGYRNSDALFIDQALRLLRPGGRLVCLLPHSLIVNAEFAKFRMVVEEAWHIRSVICLPEGVFLLNSGTTTRADIIVLEKRVSRNTIQSRTLFASVPSVGIRLNNNAKSEVSNDLATLLNNIEVQKALGI